MLVIFIGAAFIGAFITGFVLTLNPLGLMLGATIGIFVALYVTTRRL